MIKADVKQNETPKSNYGAMDSIRNEMNSSQVKEEAAQVNIISNGDLRVD